jgi:hypothetical protein
MIRKSINDKTHFKKAVIECSKYIDKGKSVDEIQSELKSEFQEHEIKSVVNLIQKAKNLPNPKVLKMLLKVTLWILLFFKTIYIINFTFSPEYSSYIKILIFILGASLNIISLYLVHKEKPYAYITAMLFGGFSLQNSSSIEGLVDYPVFSLVWSIDFFILLNLFLLTIIGFILFMKLPLGALRVKNILELN